MVCHLEHFLVKRLAKKILSKYMKIIIADMGGGERRNAHVCPNKHHVEIPRGSVSESVSERCEEQVAKFAICVS